MGKHRASIAIVLVCLAPLLGGSSCEGECQTDADCDDGVFCNGIAVCRPGAPGATIRGCVREVQCETRGGACFEEERLCEGAVGTCRFHSDCSDGVFCNGAEACNPLADRADSRGCVAGSIPCGGLECDEDTNLCMAGPCRVDDADGDGQASIACGGRDCDDDDPDVSPNVTEICDAAGVDEDCDPTTIGDRDADGDGAISMACFNGDRAGTDCDDGDASVGPRSIEVCNGTDDDCDGSVDEGLLLILYPDEDFDGYGRAGASSVSACFGPGLSAVAADCDDDNPYIMPGGIRCLSGGQGNEIERCSDEGMWVPDACSDDGEPFLTCVDQPTGLAICVPL